MRCTQDLDPLGCTHSIRPFPSVWRSPLRVRPECLAARTTARAGGKGARRLVRQKAGVGDRMRTLAAADGARRSRSSAPAAIGPAGPGRCGGACLCQESSQITHCSRRRKCTSITRTGSPRGGESASQPTWQWFGRMAGWLGGRSDDEPASGGVGLWWLTVPALGHRGAYFLGRHTVALHHPAQFATSELDVVMRREREVFGDARFSPNARQFSLSLKNRSNRRSAKLP